MAGARTRRLAGSHNGPGLPPLRPLEHGPRTSTTPGPAPLIRLRDLVATLLSWSTGPPPTSTRHGSGTRFHLNTKMGRARILSQLGSRRDSKISTSRNRPQHASPPGTSSDSDFKSPRQHQVFFSARHMPTMVGIFPKNNDIFTTWAERRRHGVTDILYTG